MGVDLTNQRFGRLLVLDFAYKEGKNTYWNCICDCGNYCLKSSHNLKYNGTKSCGCLRKEQLINRNKSTSKWNGASLGKNQRLYSIWCAMRNRCYSKNNQHYKDYGGKGIKVCSEWRDNYNAFEQWSLANGYEPTLTIDRIDFDGDYTPINCRWVDYNIQANNTCRNKYIEYNGEVHTLAEWCKILDLPYNRTKQRINACHMTVEQAFELPKQRLRRKINHEA